MINGKLFDALLLRDDGDLKAFIRLLEGLSQTERVKLFSSLLRHLTSTFFNKPGDLETFSQTPVISAVAGLISKLAHDEALKRTCLAGWLVGPIGAGPDANIAIRRAVFACLAKDENHLFDVSDESLGQFGDDLYIKHTPMLQQEGRESLYPLAHEVLDQLTRPSPCSCRSSWRWIPQSTVPPEVKNPSPLADLPFHGLEPTQLYSGHR